MSTSPPRKRPRSETMTLTPGTDCDNGFSCLGQYSFGSLQDYLTVLRRTEVGLDSCANPSKLISLPFPSLLKSSISARHSATGQYNFKHMGRAVFTTIVSEMQRLDRQTATPVVLLGTYGCGKSHLLAVLASFLFAQASFLFTTQLFIFDRFPKRKRVVFLPEASLVAEDVLHWLKLAFALPFADLPETLEKIAQFKTTQDFVDFTRAWSDEIYFLVDGMDQLDGDFKEAVLAMSSGHFRISTAYSLGKCRKVSAIRLPLGMPLDEFRKWMSHFSSRLPICSPQHVLYIHYVSGGVPALQSLYLDPNSEHFSPEFIVGVKGRPEFQAVADNIAEFHTNAIETLSASEKSRYIRLMTACLTETVPEIRHGSHRTLWDHRYVFFDDTGVGHVICGFARDTLIPLIRLEDQAGFTSDAWYSAVRSSNLAIRDSAIGQICMTRIGVAGLTQAEAQGSAMRICTFRQNPAFGSMFEDAWKNPQATSSFLNIAGPEVCGVINAVILRINPSAKMAQLIPLQISTNHTCTDLATLFFAVTWHKWERAIQEEGFKVVNTFVCVDSCTAESAEVMSAGTAFREKAKMFSPEYSVRNLSVAMLDPKLGRILRGDKYQSPPA
ncbi:hypothetical protein FB45DRAFT_1027029 [Roridomyces roridus]|uniref:Uncharacterized protein n=1 Tax=Roridomyces roridus TaxID=1738132 RepID=A0AAD7BX08_9AGAR|nr:hypothetical protein FB45DRAFT_1027029 [Roridomyces roridus]